MTRAIPRVSLAALLALLVGCGVTLDVPDGTTIVCERDQACPEGFLCSQGVCEEVLVNVAPTVSLRATARGTATLPLELVVADANGNQDRFETVALELTSVVGDVRCPMRTFDGALEGIRATRSGVTVDLTWAAITDASAECGLSPRDVDRDGDGATDTRVLPRLDEVVIEAVAIDASGARGPAGSATVELGNDAPVLVLEAPPARASGDVALAFAIEDTSRDVSQIELELALPTSPNDWRRAAIKYGAVSQVAGDGSQQLIVWDSANSEGGVGLARVSGVTLRMRAIDDVGGKDYGGFDSVTLTVDNQSAPAVESLQLLGDAFGRATSVAYLSYRAVDEQSDSIDIRAEVSINGGAFEPCTELPVEFHEGRYDLTSAPRADSGGGVPHVFAWDVAADLKGTVAEDVLVRITPADARAGIGAAAVLNVASRAGLSAAYSGTSGYTLLGRATYVGGRVHTGDVDGDGVPDVVHGTNRTDSNSIYLFRGVASGGVGTGQLGGASSYGGPTGGYRAHIVGDLDGNQYSDFVAHDESTVYVYFGGPGGLTFVQSIASAQCEPHYTRPAIGDFDGDGQNEIAIACVSAITSIRLIKRTGGVWAVDPTVYTTSQPAIRLAAGDVNGDGRDDLAVLTSASSSSVAALELLSGVAATTSLGAPQQIAQDIPMIYIDGTAFNERGLDVRVGNVVGDAKEDIVVASAPYQTNGRVQIYRGGAVNEPPLESDVFPDRSALLSLADVDGDGAQDIVTWACENRAPCAYMFGVRNNDLLSLGSAHFADDSCVTRQSTGDAVDITGDGRAELVIGEDCDGTSDVLAVYGVGEGFTPTAMADHTVLAAVPQSSNELTVLDYDHNGTLDLIVSDYATLLTQVLFNAHDLPTVRPALTVRSAGTFALSDENTSIYRVLPGDIDGDGFADLFTSHRDAFSPEISRATRSAGGIFDFANTTQAGGSGTRPNRVLAMADMNGDGFDDAIGRYDETLLILRSDHTGSTWSGTFTTVGSYTTSQYLTYAVAYDLDRDGDLDVATASSSTNVTVVLNDGNGAITASCNRTAAGSIHGIAILDTRDDGYADIVVAYDTGTGRIGLQTLPMTPGCGSLTTAPANTQFTGTVDKLGVADIDGDGIMDIYGVGPAVVAWRVAASAGIANGVNDAPVVLSTAFSNAEIVDFDRDGIADIAGFNSGTSALVAHGAQQAFFAERAVALTGIAPGRAADNFGDALTPTVLRRHFNGFGRWGENTVVDFAIAATKAGVTGSARRPLTRAYEVGGLQRLVLDEASGRYRIVDSYGALDAEAGRAVVIDLPIPVGRRGLDLATGVVVVLRADDFIRASDDPEDELSGDPAGADVLPLDPRTNAPIVVRTSSWLALPRDADGDLATGSGRRFIVENNAAAQRVRVVLDVSGVVQAFVQ